MSLQMVLAFAEGGGAVFDGVSGADVIAAEAHGAPVAPCRGSVSQSDVIHGACLDTFATGDAIMGMEFGGCHAVFHEPWIYHP